MYRLSMILVLKQTQFFPQVYNVKTLKLAYTTSTGAAGSYIFATTSEHSKWAVVFDVGSMPFALCIGDINREVRMITVTLHVSNTFRANQQMEISARLYS